MAQKKPLVAGATGTPAQIQGSDTLTPASLGTGTADGTKVLYGDGTWGDAPEGGAGGGLPNPFTVRYVFGPAVCALAMNWTTMTVNFNHFLFSAGGSTGGAELPVTGDIVFVRGITSNSLGWGLTVADGSKNGIYVVGSTADLAAVPLTRHADWGAAEGIRHGQRIMFQTYVGVASRVAVESAASVLPATNQMLYWVYGQRVNTVTGSRAVRKMTFSQERRRPVLIKARASATLPSPLVDNTVYYYDAFATQPAGAGLRSLSMSSVQGSLTQVDLTTTGSSGGSGILDAYVLMQFRASSFGLDDPLYDGVFVADWPEYYGVTQAEVNAANEGLYSWATTADIEFGRQVIGATDETYLRQAFTGFGEDLYRPDIASETGVVELGKFLASGKDNVATGQETGILIGMYGSVFHSDCEVLASTYVANIPMVTTQDSQTLRRALSLGESDATGFECEVDVHTGRMPLGLLSSGSYDLNPIIIHDFQFVEFEIWLQCGEQTSRSTGKAWRIQGYIENYSGTPQVFWREQVDAVGGSSNNNFTRITGMTVTRELDSAHGVARYVLKLKPSVYTAMPGLIWWSRTRWKGLSDTYTHTPALMFNVIPGPRVLFGETVYVGEFVNLRTDAGVLKAFRADRSSQLDARAFVVESIGSGTWGQTYIGGENPMLSGLTAGATYYLGENGAPTIDATGDGALIQELGVAVSDSIILFQRGTPIYL